MFEQSALAWSPAAARPVAPLELESAEGALELRVEDGARLVLDESLFEAVPDAPPWLELRGASPDAALELVLLCELGYQSAQFSAAALAPSANGGLRLGLRRALELPTRAGVLLWQVLAQAADLEACEFWLQVRLVGSAAELAPHEPECSAWLRGSFAPSLRERLVPR